MPLVRVEVRNEYALGAPELYRDVNLDDPKELLEGVAVAGLVGVLRQLGDLAEFAAEVFHGLQEEVTITSSRSNKLKIRVQRIEAALSPLEKAVLAQRSHLHFAYTAGSNWRTRIRCKENHFIYSDVPSSIMNSYEGCRSPPRLHLLDRFDPEGPGSCLKRYSDPTFFKRASTASGEPSTEKTLRKKSRKIKKRRSWPSNRGVSRDTSFSYHSGRMRSSQPVGVHTSPSQTMSTYDATRSDLGKQSNLGLRSGSDYIDGDFRPSYSIQEQESREPSTPVKRRDSDFLDYTFFEEKTADAYDDIQINLSREQAGCSSSSVTWDEKTESLEPTPQYDHGMIQYDHNDMIKEENHDGMIKEEIHDDMIKEQDQNGLIKDKDHDSMIKDEDHDSRIKEEDYNNTIKEEDYNNMIKEEDYNYMIKEEDYNNMIKEEDHDKNIQSVSPNSYQETQVDNALNFGAVYKICSQPFSQVVQTVESGDAHYDEIESETDHFMDALNTIESESETDVDCPKKAGMELHAVLEDKGVDGRKQEIIRHNLDFQSTNSEFNSLTKSSLINGNGGDYIISVSPKCPRACDFSINGVEITEDPSSVSLVEKGLQSTKKAEESLDPGSSRSIDPYENGNINGEASMESISSEISPNFRDDGRVMPISDATRRRPESLKHAPETSSVASVTFWTNGGLLGLQPSKPPDFSILNGPPSKKDENISSSIQNTSISDQDPRNLDQAESFRNIKERLDTDYSEYQKSGASFRKASWKISPTVLDIKLGKPGDSLYSNIASSTKAIQNTSGNSVPVNSELEASRKPQENGRISSRMFELGNRVLSNGSNEKMLPSEQKNGQNVAHRTFSGRTKGLLGGEPPIQSPNSSPPLRHMKISFPSLHGYEASKLKLQFPEENTNNESSREMFPSFQLVPELSIARHRIGSDSDDDTFYRSSSSLSNDCHSPQSESDSEQWESGESPGSKDHDVYDALRRMSLDESVPTVSKNGTSNLDLHENGFQNSLSCRSFDLHSLDTLSHSFREELRSYADPKDLVVSRFAPSPAPPPPLPPVQWRGMYPNLGGAENSSKAISEGSNHAFEKLSTFTISQQPKPAPLNHVETFRASNLQHSKQSSLNPVVRREPNRSKSMNEREDFLHQIRTKSFNLRPTGKLKPSETSEGSANVQVAAILEKANAIRQAVGSDDDSNWSET